MAGPAAVGAVGIATGFGALVGLAIERPLQARIKAWLARDSRRPALAPAE